MGVIPTTPDPLKATNAATAPPATQCKRDRCTRWKDLNEFGICGGHTCRSPGCKETKSHQDKLCKRHTEWSTDAVPKGWAKIKCGDHDVWLHLKLQIAKYSHPKVDAEWGLKPTRDSKIAVTKTKKGAPTNYYVTPQPNEMPEPWELVLAVPDNGTKLKDQSIGQEESGATRLFLNTADNSIQFSDPRPKKVAPGEIPLPAGWERAFDDEGDPFYRNVNTGVQTYDDPRVVLKPTPAMSLGIDDGSEPTWTTASPAPYSPPTSPPMSPQTSRATSRAPSPPLSPRPSAAKQLDFANNSTEPKTDEELVEEGEEGGNKLTRKGSVYSGFGDDVEGEAKDDAQSTSPSEPDVLNEQEHQEKQQQQQQQQQSVGSTQLSSDDTSTVTTVVKSKKTSGPQEPWEIGPCDVVEFKLIDDNLTFEDDIPEAVRNKIHNRYMDILPNPRTRINLPLIANDKTSIYVNANYVTGPNGDPKYYICAMGPKPTTVNNFWRMIWQEKPVAILMLTGLVEQGQPKCERYWPGVADGKTIRVHGDIRIITLKSVSRRGYVRSTIKAVGFDPKQRKRVSHTMEHFWYNTWPDHGVPRTATLPIYTDDTLAMLLECGDYLEKSKLSGPLLVHCSAGIGRSGTAIAIDHCMYNLRNNGKCDPLRSTAEIRNDRCALVQHPQQFKFVHAAAVRYCQKLGKKYKVEKIAKPLPGMTLSRNQEIEVRRKEKDAARRKAQNADVDSRLKIQTLSELSGELSLGSITYDGTEHEYVDPDSDGFMRLAVAIEAGFPRALFKLLDEDAAGIVTPAQFKEYQRRQMRDALKDALFSTDDGADDGNSEKDAV